MRGGGKGKGGDQERGEIRKGEKITGITAWGIVPSDDSTWEEVQLPPPTEDKPVSAVCWTRTRNTPVVNASKTRCSDSF